MKDTCVLQLHLVTEFIDNGTLQRLIMDDSVPLSWGLKIELAGDIANGMAFLHERSVIHRDLKTENCLVRSDMSVVVADFGLARVMRGQQLKKKHPSESKLRHSVRISSSSGGVAPHFQPQAMTVVGTPGRFYQHVSSQTNMRVYSRPLEHRDSMRAACLTLTFVRKTLWLPSCFSARTTTRLSMSFPLP
eukprot:TRINITY_DN9658_c0_g1_i4.p1 TRINITY_DN9658_c0_g1~~TRINITY_DN9658_c0_g1_i4.p1  ORF type:complete len:190 (+),score=14.05 TRINITY_DN9658_c0_g1_i4:187-756(+)